MRTSSSVGCSCGEDTATRRLRAPEDRVPCRPMAGAIQPASARAGVTFEVERAEVQDHLLVVTGHWSGVRGMRFMRPTLVVAGRPLLATLEHKPWAPDDDPWVAAFPWPGGEPDLREMALAVAPSVTVPLHPDAAVDTPAPAAAEPVETTAPQDPARLREERLETEVGFLREELRTVTAERDALRAELDGAHAKASAAGAEVQSVQESHDELHAARTAAERERDRLAAQLDETLQDRNAAVRTRQRMEAQRDEAAAALASVEAERDEAQGQRAEAVARRDDVL